MRRAHALASAAVLPQELLTSCCRPSCPCARRCVAHVSMSVAACRRLPSGVRAIAGGRAGAHVSAFLALGSLALTLIVVVGRVLLLLCCNVNRTNSVELLTLDCSSSRLVPDLPRARPSAITIMEEGQALRHQALKV